MDNNPKDLRFLGSIGGRVFSAGSPSLNGTGGGASLLDAQGLILSAVVVATYVQLDEQNPAFAPDAEGNKMINRVVGVYCDVITYSSKQHLNGHPLKRVLVADSTGMHTGRTWMPRAATMDVKESQSVEGMQLGTMNPRFLDGDHVMVQFLDNNMARPVITGRLPHPQTGLGNEDLESPGHRQRLKQVDGSPDFMKHNGTFYGVDKLGGFAVDTTRAHDGKYGDNGVEEPADDDTHGDVVFKVKAGQTFRVEGVDPQGSQNTFLLTGKDGDLTLRLQDSNSTIRLHRVNSKDVVTLDVNDAADPGPDAHLELSDGKLDVTMGGLDSKSMRLDTTTGKFTVKVGGVDFELAHNGGTPAVTIGDGSDNAVLFFKLATWWSQQMAVLNAFMATYNSHTHTVSTAGTAAAQAGTSAPTTMLQVETLDPLAGDTQAGALRLRPGST